MKNRLVTSLVALIMLLCGATAASADIKVRTKTSMSGHSYEGTTYIKKSRQRTEQNFGGMSMANIMQCDLRRNIQINDKARTYLITPFSGGASTAGDGNAGSTPPSTSKPAQARRGGIITFTYNVIDTGERKQMFGMTARHLKSSMSTGSSPDACSPSKMKMETDGWYVDLEYGIDCEMGAPGNIQVMREKSDCVDEYRTRMTGAGKLGYPLLQTTTMFDDNGRETTKVTIEVLELSTVSLDAALFDIPAGYSEAKSAQQFYTTSAMSQAQQAAAADASDEVSGAANKSTSAANRPAAVAAASIPGAVLASTPKKEGTIRIGIVLPTSLMRDGVPSIEASEAVRNTFAGFINGPSIEVVALNARLPEQAIEEARQSQCDYILYSGLTQKKGGGMFGKVMGGVAGAAGSVIPYGGSAGEVAARTAATTAIYTTAAIAGSVKAKDELTLEYKLQSTGSDRKLVVSNTTKAKAKTDGEDIVTPLVEKAAQEIVAAVKK